MDDKLIVLLLIFIILLLLLVTIKGACLYAIALCLVRRFHKPLNLLTLNVCVTVFVGGSFWAVYFTMNTFFYDVFWTAESCVPILYLETVTNCLFLYAINVVSINRLFTIFYRNKILFQNNKWVIICVAIQWILAIVLPTPTLRSDVLYCLLVGFEFRYRVYSLIITVMISTIGLVVTNSIIFIHTYRSSRRVQPNQKKNDQRLMPNKRDVRLLKHMIFLFAVIFIGWIPIYIAMVINAYVILSYAVYLSFRLLPAICLLIEVIDLFWYNHELRQYLKDQLQRRRRINSATIVI